MNSVSKMSDAVLVAAGYGRPVQDRSGLSGWVEVDLFDERGDLKLHLAVPNLITEVGDEYYGERAAGIASPPNQVSGMRLGTGTTAVAKTGAGAAIVTYVTGSSIAIDGSFPTSALSGASRRIQWKTTWAPGVATASAISEVVITNEASLTNVAGTAANTVSRALLSPTVNKAAGDTLAVTWNHDLLGA